MKVDYYSKYLKYKSKYLELKTQIGGDCTKSRQYFPIKNNWDLVLNTYDNCVCTFVDENTKQKCDCTAFSTNSTVFDYDDKGLRVYIRCNNCQHHKDLHKS